MKEADYKALRTKVLGKAGSVNLSLKEKLDYKEALNNNGITNEELNLIGFEYNQEKNILERVRYVTFKDIQEMYPKSREKEQLKEIQIGNEVEANGEKLENCFLEQNKNKLQELFNNYEVLMQIVEMFKSNNKIDSKDRSIIIELPFEDDKQFKASYRVNKTINNQFKEFCKRHKEYSAKDLISQALKEYMDNHN